MSFQVALIAIVGLWLLTGCRRNEPQPAAIPAPKSPAEAAGAPVAHLAQAQTNLPTVRLWLGGIEVDAQVCLTVPQIATGLMFREGIGTNETMLFAFRGADQRGFYMKNVKFPIAVAYIDPEGAIQEIVHLQAFNTNPVYSRGTDIQFVLEAAPDFFQRNGINTGAVVTLPQGRLRDRFGPRAQAW